jgi:hypothetical protein
VKVNTDSEVKAAVPQSGEPAQETGQELSKDISKDIGKEIDKKPGVQPSASPKAKDAPKPRVYAYIDAYQIVHSPWQTELRELLNRWVDLYVGRFKNADGNTDAMALFQTHIAIELMLDPYNLLHNDLVKALSDAIEKPPEKTMSPEDQKMYLFGAYTQRSFEVMKIARMVLYAK